MNPQDYIDTYFEGALTDEERLEFENQLAMDAELAENFAYQKQLKKAITLNARAELKEKLQEFESETKKPKTFKIWYAAASIVLLCGLGYYFTMNTNGLYDNYYQTYPNVVAPTVRGNVNDDLISKAFFEYDEGNYQKSLELFSEIYEYDQSTYALFYKAVSLMELKKYKPAIAIFSQVIDTKDTDFKPFAKWYKALAYLKIGEKGKSIFILNDLSSTENPQQEQAKKLLAELE